MRSFKVRSPILHIPDALKEELSWGLGGDRCTIIDQIVSDTADEFQTQLIYTCVWYKGVYYFFKEMQTASGTFLESRLLEEGMAEAGATWDKTHDVKFPLKGQIPKGSWVDFVRSKAT